MINKYFWRIEQKKLGTYLLQLKTYEKGKYKKK